VGTSSSHSGPGDGPGLLPSWATPENGDGGDDSNATPDSNAGPESADEEGSAPVATPQPQSRLWTNAKSTMTRYAGTGGGSSNSGRLRSAGAGYVRAKGGSRSAGASAISGRTTTGRLGGFLSSAAGSGFRAALESIGLRGVVGQSSEVVLARLVDTLAPSGATREEAAARRATVEVLAFLYDSVAGDAGDVSALDDMDATIVEQAVEMSVSGYIYNRWLDELGLSIEKGAVSETNAIRLEADVREYVASCVSLELGEQSVLDVNWDGTEGRGIIDRVFRDAYAVLEAAE